MTQAKKATGSPTLRLRITAAAESAVRGGHPWVYSDSIREQNRDARAGELGVVFDRRDRFLAIGLFDPASPIRLRVLHTGRPAAIDSAWWRERLRAAIGRRQGLFDEATTGFRWIHGENDGWPGLALDRYASTLVMKVYSAAWLPWLADITALFHEELQPQHLVARFSRNVLAHAEEAGWRDGTLVATTGRPRAASPADELSRTPFRESGLRFEADVVRGQKTGFFLDQRENRRRVERWAEGRAVLNAFSFSGGFSLYSARGGAVSVTDLDISPHALAAAKRNWALNHDVPTVKRCHHETLQADAFEYLGEKTTPQFDLVILDPPSLARREAERAGAIQAYERLAGAALITLRDGGVLVAASCSAHVTAEEFFQAVRRAATRSGRPFQERETTGHPPDHPATFPEAHYLKCIYLELGARTARPQRAPRQFRRMRA